MDGYSAERRFRRRKLVAVMQLVGPPGSLCLPRHQSSAIALIPVSICGLLFDFLHIGCWGVVASCGLWIAGSECDNALNVHMVLGAVARRQGVKECPAFKG
ncbi:hypothetical protein AGR2A_Cc100020 [Agrobacterium genomosp. 2 str. CFBP 5494]|uniref:Uncharacterized protein n=1 Tax=Agrobacterium genomosp. 2 str. CFBP 5494 TaxID=1183436 RepID=A0A9W5F0L7_9HYPH|nr:hypothetical protein AGR2A_Cc100020 [Agrobacterium genomosp. 2 str. CFBP 5494]